MGAVSRAPVLDLVEERVRRREASDVDAVREAFEAEALPHIDSVYRLALRLSGDPVLSDDLVQETMLKAYRAWDRYEQGTNIRAWLFTILRNTLISEYRNRRRHADSIDVADVEAYRVFEEVQELDPAGRFFDQIVDREVARAVAELPEDFREALVLSDIEGLPYSEIAEIVQVPVGTVKSRLHRARQALQRTLYDYAVETGYIAPRVAGAA